MTKRSAPADTPRPAAAQLAVQRIRVNRDGYDDTGAYWGAGPDVFIATTPDGSEEITVRAASIADARKKAQAELDRAPGKAAAPNAALGGKAARQTRYEIEWTNPVDRKPVKIRITHARNYLVQGTDHIEIEAIKPKRQPLPITETGYLSHFIDWQQLSAAGGPVTFVTAWLAREGAAKPWVKREQARAQGDLFQWAEAQGEVARSKPSPRRRDGRPSRQRSNDRDPS